MKMNLSGVGRGGFLKKFKKFFQKNSEKIKEKTKKNEKEKSSEKALKRLKGYAFDSISICRRIKCEKREKI